MPQINQPDQLIVLYEPKWDEVTNFDLLEMLSEIENNMAKYEQQQNPVPNDMQVEIQKPTPAWPLLTITTSNQLL